MKKLVAFLVLVMCVLTFACQSKPETQKSAEPIITAPKVTQAVVKKEMDPCDPQFITKEVEIEELKLKELKKMSKNFSNLDLDDEDFSYEDYTDLTYNWDLIQIKRKQTNTKKDYPEILNYFFKISESTKYGKGYIPEYFREDKAIPYSEKLFQGVLTSPEKVAAQVADFIKTIPKGKELALKYGKEFIENYMDMPWDAKVGVLKKRTTISKNGLNGKFCDIESLTQEIQNSHPAKRDAQGRFINDALKQCIPDIYDDFGGGFICPVEIFQNEEYEDWGELDKQVWRAGPKFYANMVKIIRLVWQELGIEDPTIK